MRKPKKRDLGLLPVSNILQELFVQDKSPLADQFQRWKLWQNWSVAVGPVIARYSAPVLYDRGTLVIWVKSSAHMHEMAYVMDALREKINRHVGQDWVRFIRLTMDRKDVATPPESATDSHEFLSRQSPNEDGEPPPGRSNP